MPGLAFSKRIDLRRTGKMGREDRALGQASYREGKSDFPLPPMRMSHNL